MEEMAPYGTPCLGNPCDCDEPGPTAKPERLTITRLHKLIDIARRKNRDYAQDGSEFGNFDRVAAILALYPALRLNSSLVVALTYALKQVDCILWGLNARQAHSESLEDRANDVAIYFAIIAEKLYEIQRQKNECDEIRAELDRMIQEEFKKKEKK